MTEVYKLAVILVICVIGGIAGLILVTLSIFCPPTMPMRFVTIDRGLITRILF